MKKMNMEIVVPNEEKIRHTPMQLSFTLKIGKFRLSPWKKLALKKSGRKKKKKNRRDELENTKSENKQTARDYIVA